MQKLMTRRSFLQAGAALGGLTLGGCASMPVMNYSPPIYNPVQNSFGLMYGPRPEEQFPLPAIDPKDLPPQFRRRQVNYVSNEKPGSVVVDTRNFYLYLVEPGNRAMRYGVGLGRQGFEWAGRARIAWKRAWPTWTPPDEMIAREPQLEKWSVRNGGMEPGLDNPLGARALYIFQGNEDTLYRLHGTNQPNSIGKAVSSGCVRLVNQDVIDLYDRVRADAPILVI